MAVALTELSFEMKIKAASAASGPGGARNIHDDETSVSYQRQRCGAWREGGDICLPTKRDGRQIEK